MKLSDKDLKKVIRRIINQNTPADPPVLERYGMTKEQLRKGVHCPQCNYLPLSRVYGSWYCPKCSLRFKNAHIHSLKDYSMLISSEIRNSQIRDFLQIPSHSLATRLIGSMNLTSTGTKKGRVYKLSF